MEQISLVGRRDICFSEKHFQILNGEGSDIKVYSTPVGTGKTMMEFSAEEIEVLEKYHFKFNDNFLAKEQFDFIDNKLQSDGVPFVFHFIDNICDFDNEVYLSIVKKIMLLNPILTLESGCNIMHIIARHSLLCYVELLELFHEYPAMESGNSPLHTASVNGNYEVVEHFLKSGKYDPSSYSSDEDGTPIELAFQSGFYNCVFLIASYIDYDWERDCYSFVRCAQENQDEEFLSLLDQRKCV